jgi:hypothetical protein
MLDFSSRIHRIVQELRSHLPFTLIGVFSALAFLAIVYWLFIPLAHLNPATTYTGLFHGFHFGHVFLSAIATTSIFIRHQRNIIKTVWIGYLASLIPCGISDVFLPFLGGRLLLAPIKLHLCLLEEPGFVFLANTLGIAIGILFASKHGKVSYFSHGAHVFVSSFASLFYLVSFGIENWLVASPVIVIITTLAVIIPCCSSDIIIPLSFVTGIHGHEHEDEHTIRPD